MKPTRRSIIIPLIIVLFVLLISCHQVSKHAYKYPEEYSAEYCYYDTNCLIRILFILNVTNSFQKKTGDGIRK
jgi:hypothetical protein